jgi:hypothetical protein
MVTPQAYRHQAVSELAGWLDVNQLSHLGPRLTERGYDSLPQLLGDGRSAGRKETELVNLVQDLGLSGQDEQRLRLAIGANNDAAMREERQQERRDVSRGMSPGARSPTRAAVDADEDVPADLISWLEEAQLGQYAIALSQYDYSTVGDLTDLETNELGAVCDQLAMPGGHTARLQDAVKREQDRERRRRPAPVAAAGGDSGGNPTVRNQWQSIQSQLDSAGHQLSALTTAWEEVS